MDDSRRGFLKALAATSAVGAAAAAGLSDRASASAAQQPPADAVGMLYDTTLCIGCKTCVVACHAANNLPPDDRTAVDGLYDAPQRLNDRTKNIIKLCKEGERISYMKQQCMHCVDPGCVGACMIGALKKRDFGIVTWDGNRCIGCRYCQVACPYNVPKFEWASSTPKIVKCELCVHRIREGKTPACCEVCPRQAVIFGKRDELLVEAKRRLAAHPGRYVDKVYGEHDGGGTQVLYLSHVPFASLGLPDLGDKAVGALNRDLQHGLYQGFLVPAALYGVLATVIWRNRRMGVADGAAPSPPAGPRSGGTGVEHD